jgi:hypothetical protein
MQTKRPMTAKIAFATESTSVQTRETARINRLCNLSRQYRCHRAPHSQPLSRRPDAV